MASGAVLAAALPKAAGAPVALERSGTGIAPAQFSDLISRPARVRATDAPAPNGDAAGHMRFVGRAILDVAERSDGGMFALFTSHRDVRLAADELRALTERFLQGFGELRALQTTISQTYENEVLKPARDVVGLYSIIESSIESRDSLLLPSLAKSRDSFTDGLLDRYSPDVDAGLDAVLTALADPPDERNPNPAR